MPTSEQSATNGGLEAAWNYLHACAPADFAIEGIPYSRYIRQSLTVVRNGKQVVVVAYFDKDAYPTEASREMWPMGGFPGHFRISVDVETLEVVDCNTDRQ